MWISKKKRSDLEKRVADLEQKVQSQQEVLQEINEIQKEEVAQMKHAFAEVEKNVQTGVIEAILKMDHASRQT